MALYQIVYAKTENGVQARYQRSYKDWLVDQWLEQNCRGRYYHSPGWRTEKFIEFEDSKDAVLFAMRWT